MIPLHILTSFNKLFLCSFYLASVTGEEIFVNMTLFPMFLLSSSVNSESNS